MLVPTLPTTSDDRPDIGAEMMDKDTVSNPLLAMLLPTLSPFSDSRFPHCLKMAKPFSTTQFQMVRGRQASLLTQTRAMEVRLVSSE